MVSRWLPAFALIPRRHEKHSETFNVLDGEVE